MTGKQSVSFANIDILNAKALVDTLILVERCVSRRDKTWLTSSVVVESRLKESQARSPSIHGFEDSANESLHAFRRGERGNGWYGPEGATSR